MEALVQYNAMRQALIKAHSVDEIKLIHDRAEALRAVAKQSGEHLEHQNMLAEMKIRCERRGGELLAEMEKDVGGRPSINSAQHERSLSEYSQAVKSANLSESSAKRWQQIADIPEPVFEQHVTQLTKGQKELTTAATLKLAKSIAYQKKDSERAAVTSSLPPTVKLFHGDFREQCQQSFLPAGSI